jgi:hypothetical protein
MTFALHLELFVCVIAAVDCVQCVTRKLNRTVVMGGIKFLFVCIIAAVDCVQCITRKLNRTVVMGGIKFLLFLVLMGTTRCSQSAPNSTWWPCTALNPYQNLQLEQVMLFICLRFYRYPKIYIFCSLRIS